MAFAATVWISRPAAAPARSASQVTDLGTTTALVVPRGVVMHPLALPARMNDVDLSAIPDRLANEAAPSSWRRVVTVRGVPGVASAEGPAVVAWTENGIAYWLASPTRSTEELIQIADELR
jgi:hypothetical protein